MYPTRRQSNPLIAPQCYTHLRRWFWFLFDNIGLRRDNTQLQKLAAARLIHFLAFATSAIRPFPRTLFLINVVKGSHRPLISR